MSIKTLYVLLFLLISSGLKSKEQKLNEASLVSLAEVKSEQVKPVMWLPGNVVSRNSATISAEQSGQLLWIADIGSKVNKGEIIARIDSKEIELQFEQIKAEMQQLQANVDFLEKQKKRMQALVLKMSTSHSEVDRTDRDLAVSRSQLEVLKLRLLQTQLHLKQTIILAPFDGEVSQKFSQVGELVSDRTTLLQLTDIHTLDIQIAAPLDIAGYIQENSEVLVKWKDNITNLPIRTWSSAGNQTSRTFDIRLDASDLPLFPGSAVTVSLPRNEESIATLVPRDALILREDEISVLKVGLDNIVEKTLVQVGLGMDDWVSVVGNIAALDQVVIRGGEDLSSGQKIRVN